jgi:hypothetical protein
MRKLDQYKTEISRLDDRLQHLLDVEIIDRDEVAELQEDLDRVAESYTDEEIGISIYKLYEIQAYILFIDEKLNDAERCIHKAISIKGRRYNEAEILLKFITDKRDYLIDVLAQRLQEQGRNDAIKGFLWFLGALVITVVSYSWAAGAAKNSSDGTATYYVFWGPMLFGVYALLRGIYLYFNSLHKAEEILDQVDD